MSTKQKAAPVVMVVAAAVGAAVGSALVNQYFASRRPATIDKALVQAANEINKALPMMVDAETRLNSTAALPGKSFVYHYTLINTAKKDIGDIDTVAKKMRPAIVNGYRTNVALKQFRDQGVTMRYQYVDKHGNFLFEIVVGPGDLQAK